MSYIPVYPWLPSYEIALQLAKDAMLDDDYTPEKSWRARWPMWNDTLYAMMCGSGGLIYREHARAFAKFAAWHIGEGAYEMMCDELQKIAPDECRNGPFEIPPKAETFATLLALCRWRALGNYWRTK